MTSRVVRFTATGVDDRIGRLEGDEIVDVGLSDAQGFIPTPESWEHVVSAPRRSVFTLASVRLRPPVVPGKILCFEMGNDLQTIPAAEDGRHAHAAGTKFSSSVIASGEPIRIPVAEEELLFRPCLALVVGRRRRHPGEPALSSIGGYSAMTDLLGPQTLAHDRNPTLARGYDTFAPMGPSLVRADSAVWDDIELSARVNDRVLHGVSVRQLSPSIEEILDLLWPNITLTPGDIIAIGARFADTSGVGVGAGDVITVTAGASGHLTNSVLLSDY